MVLRFAVWFLLTPRSQSNSSHSFVLGRNMNTIDFSDDNFWNDAQSSDDIFAAQDEQIRYKSSGEIDRSKARFVGQVSNSWFVFQLDVNNAFLYDDLVETVYTKPSEGYFPSGLGIHIIKNSGISLKAFSDADWHNSLSKSSTEVEYKALASVTSEVIWILKILKDLNFDNFLPISLYCDSNSTIKIAVNPVFHERTKYLKIDLHFVRENCLSGVVKTVKFDSENQIADILTKGLDTLQHKFLVEKLGSDVVIYCFLVYKVFHVLEVFKGCYKVERGFLPIADSHLLGDEIICDSTITTSFVRVILSHNGDGDNNHSDDGFGDVEGAVTEKAPHDVDTSGARESKPVVTVVSPTQKDSEEVSTVFDGAFGGVGDKEVVVGEGVVVTYSSLEMLTNSCLGRIMVSLIFSEGLEEEDLVEFMVEWFEEDEDGKKNGKEGLFNLKA
ncbi:ribonuclease H-like domain-containing protein [Tanacetum coccineum]